MNVRHWSLGIASILLAVLAWGCEGPKAENDHDHDHAHEAGDHDHGHDGDGHDHDGADHDSSHDHDHDHASSEEPSAERAQDYRKQATEAREEIAKIRSRIESGGMDAAEAQNALMKLEDLMEKSAEIEAAAARFEAAESDGHDH